MLKFIHKKCEERVVQINNIIDNKSTAYDLSLKAFPDTITIECVNIIFEKLSDHESDYLLNVYNNFSIKMSNNYRVDEVKQLLSSTGDDIVKLINRMKLIDYCKTHPFESIDITNGSIKISFVNMVLLLKMMIPIIVQCRDMHQRIMDKPLHHPSNDLAMFRVLKSVFDTFFIKEITFIKKRINEIINDHPSFVSRFDEQNRFKTMAIFNEYVFLRIVIDVLINVSPINNIIMDTINDHVNFIVKNQLKEMDKKLQIQTMV